MLYTKIKSNTEMAGKNTKQCKWLLIYNKSTNCNVNKPLSRQYRVIAYRNLQIVRLRVLFNNRVTGTTSEGGWWEAGCDQNKTKRSQELSLNNNSVVKVCSFG